MVIESYVQCDICEKKFVEEIENIEEMETTGRNIVYIRNLDGIREYDVCDVCIANMNIIKDTGRNVIITTYETIS